MRAIALVQAAVDEVRAGPHDRQCRGKALRSSTRDLWVGRYDAG
jgi:hypothetical protein